MAKRVASNAVSKACTMLDEMPSGSVVLDKFGHAWQSGFLYWYRAYGDDSEVSAWELAFSEPFRVLHEGEQ